MSHQYNKHTQVDNQTRIDGFTSFIYVEGHWGTTTPPPSLKQMCVL